MKYIDFEPLVLERIKQGCSSRAIADEIIAQRDRSDTEASIRRNIRLIAYRNGFLRFNKSKSTKRTDVVEQRRSGLTLQRIGDIHGITRQAVWAICKRAGL